MQRALWWRGGALQAAHQVSGEGLFAAVPEGVHEDLVVLDGDRVHGRVNVKSTALHRRRTNDLMTVGSGG